MISDKKDAAFNIQEFRLIAELAPIMIWLTDESGAYRYFNKAWFQFTGQAADAQPDGLFSQVAYPEDYTRYTDLFKLYLEQRMAFKFSCRVRHFGGAYHIVAIQMTPQYNAAGHFIGFVGAGAVTGHGVINEHRAHDRDQSLSEALEAANEELRAANEELMASNDELKDTQDNLFHLNRNLEQKVIDRTFALTESEAAAQALNEELRSVNEELTATNEELQQSNQELYESRERLSCALEELTAAKEAIEKSERLFKSIAVNIPNSLVLVVDPEHRFIAVEGDLMQRLDYDGDRFIGKHPKDVLPPGRYEAVRPLYERMMAGEHFTTERKSDAGIDFLVNFVPLRNEQGDIYAGLIIAIDITTIKEAEKKSAHLAAIVESSDDAIVSKTLDSIVTSWNKSAERLFGYTSEEMVGVSIVKLIPADRVREEDDILARLRKGERVSHFETVRQAKDGKLINVSLTISPVKDTNGAIIGASKIARDITAQKKEEQRKNDFIGMVSHELKTPLTTLTAIIQLLKLKLQHNDDSFIAGAADMAHVQTKRMSNLINGFLDISRLESGRLQLEKETFDIEALIREHIVEASFSAPDHRISFHAATATPVSADKDKIGSVISNLINNATKYAPPDKVIEVGCSADSDSVTVWVKDQGIGIDSQDLTRIFERYYRVESMPGRKIAGFGIGLYLSAEIILQHGGQIWAESTPGLGSTFFFRLPLGA